MSLYKFKIPPNQKGYSVDDGIETISTRLDGGASRFRRDILGSASTASVQWALKAEDYKYFRIFYRSITASGSLPFLIDLVLNDFELEEREVYFIPGSVRLVEKRGTMFIVSARLEICHKPDEFSEGDIASVVLFSDLGSDWETEFPIIEDEFDTEINEVLPAIGMGS